MEISDSNWFSLSLIEGGVLSVLGSTPIILTNRVRGLYADINAGQTPGFPRLKSLGRFPGFSFNSHGDGWRFTPWDCGKHGSLRRSGMGEIRVSDILHRDGQWYLSLTVSIASPQVAGLGTPANRSAGRPIWPGCNGRTHAEKHDPQCRWHCEGTGQAGRAKAGPEPERSCKKFWAPPLGCSHRCFATKCWNLVENGWRMGREWVDAPTRKP